MADMSKKIKLDEYMSEKGMTKEEVFQAISRKEISGNFVGGDWYISDDRKLLDEGAETIDAEGESDPKTDAKMTREKEEALKQIAMAQTMAKTAQTKARKTSKTGTKAAAKKTTSGDRSKKEGKAAAKSEKGSAAAKPAGQRKLSLKDSGMAESILAQARDLALGPDGAAKSAPASKTTVASGEKNPMATGKLSIKDSGIAESILAEARELALGPQAKEDILPEAEEASSLAASILEEARDLARLQESIANTKFDPPISDPVTKPEKTATTPKLIAKQFDDQLLGEDAEEEERWKTKLDQYVFEKGITLDDAYKMITTKQIDGQFIGGEWYVIDSDEEHEERKNEAAANAALAEQRQRAEEARKEALRREEARRKMKIGENMLDKGLTKEEVFRLIQDKTVEGHFSDGEWYVLESVEDLLAREQSIQLEEEARAREEKEKEEAYRERRHEAGLQDGLNEEERSRALNMPYITDAKFADRTTLKTIGVAQGSTVRSKNLPPELAKEGATMPGAELVAFTAELAEARAQAIDRMRIDAFLKGANAIVSTQFSTSMIDIGAIEIMVYGTAVLVSMSQ